MTFSDPLHSIEEASAQDASLHASDPVTQPHAAISRADNATSGTLALVDLSAHKTMEEALPFSVEWEGTTYRVFVPRSVLEDLDQATSYRQDEQMIASFRRNEALILKRTLVVLEKGRGRWGTVLLKQYDFPELFQ